MNSLPVPARLLVSAVIFGAAAVLLASLPIPIPDPLLFAALLVLSSLTAVLKVNYAPIEQYADGDAELVQGPWSDLYSLAAVVHGCLCNDTPLPSTLRAIRDRMVPFARVARTVQRQFGDIGSEADVVVDPRLSHGKNPPDRGCSPNLDCPFPGLV